MSSTSYLSFMVLIFLMNLCFAVALPLLKQAIGYAPPLLVVSARMILGGLLVGMLGKISGECVVPMRQWNWKLLVSTACVAMYMVCVGEAIALEYMSATRASLIWALLPCITATIGWIGYGQSLRRKQVCSIFLGTIGMIVLVMGSAPLGDLFTISCSSVDALMLGAVIAAGWAYFLISRVIEEGYGILQSNALIMLLGGVMSFVTWLVFYDFTAAASILWWPFIGYSAMVAVIVNVIGLSLQNFLIVRYPIAFLALSSCITPMTSSVIGVYVLGEAWRAEYTIAATCIMLGLLLFYYEELQKLYKGVYA